MSLKSISDSGKYFIFNAYWLITRHKIWSTLYTFNNNKVTEVYISRVQWHKDVTPYFAKMSIWYQNVQKNVGFPGNTKT